MRRILVDTNAYAAFKRGRSEAVEVFRLADHIGLSAVVVGELLAGFAGGQRERTNRAELADFLTSPRVSLLELGSRTAEFYALVFQALRRKGKPIPSNDLWIAATALEHGYALFTYDDHFAAVEGVLSGNQPEAFLP